MPTSDYSNDTISAIANIIDNINNPFFGSTNIDNNSDINFNKIDFTVAPNEYANIYAYNKCLSKLLNNDIQTFNKIGTYGALIDWNLDTLYKKGNRICFVNYKVFESSDKIKILICVKDNVYGRDVIPSESNTLDYFDALSYDYLPDNIVWIEDAVYMSAFQLDTNGLSLEEFNANILKELPVLNYSNKNNFVNNKILVNTQFKETYNGTLHVSWPANRPTAYTDFAVSSYITAKSNPASLFYLENTTTAEQYTAKPNLNDYIISSYIDSLYSNESLGAGGTRWVRKWNSGFVEQGGTIIVTFTDKTEDTSRPISKIIGEDTYLIGVHDTADFLCKAEIEPILEVGTDFELFSATANLQNVIWYDKTTLEEDTNVSSFILNNQLVFGLPEQLTDNDLTRIYNSITFCFTGTCYNVSDSNTNEYKIYNALSCGTKAVISWEAQGILL